MPNALSLRLFLVAFLSCLLVVGCGGGSQGQQSSLRFDGKDAIEPAAGAWATWLLPRGDALRPSAVKSSSSELAAEIDELLGLQTQRTAQHKALILFWNGGSVRRWNEECRQLIARRSTNPPRAARALALLSVATCDAMVAMFTPPFALDKRANDNVHC